MESPFLKEKRALLGAISSRVGKIIECHQTETALRQSEDTYKVLVQDSIQGMVIAQGMPLRLVFASAPAAAMLGGSIPDL